MKTVYDKTLLNRFTDQVLNLILFKKKMKNANTPQKEIITIS